MVSVAMSVFRSHKCEYRGKEELPMVEKDRTRTQLSKMYIHKSSGLDGMHLRMLRELGKRGIFAIFKKL